MHMNGKAQMKHGGARFYAAHTTVTSKREENHLPLCISYNTNRRCLPSSTVYQTRWSLPSARLSDSRSESEFEVFAQKTHRQSANRMWLRLEFLH